MSHMPGTARTADEIVARAHAVASDDFFGFVTGELVTYLPFDRAKPFLKDDATAEKWGEPSSDSVRTRIVEYLPFAWSKANDCRGLSANRSINHFEAWLFLDGHNPAVLGSVRYEFYGKPALVLVSEIYGFDWAAHDNGEWVNDEYGASHAHEDIVAQMRTIAAAHRRTS